MVVRSVALTTALLLGACATVSNETRTQAVLETGLNAGERYEIRTRLLEGPNGSFEQTSVVYRGYSKTCRIDSPNDCKLAARQLIEEYDELFF